jgi:hypothetical protein
MKWDLFSPREDADVCDLCESETVSSDCYPCRYCLNVRTSRAAPVFMARLNLDSQGIREYLTQQDPETLERWEHNGPTNEERDEMREIMYGTD